MEENYLGSMPKNLENDEKSCPNAAVNSLSLCTTHQSNSFVSNVGGENGYMNASSRDSMEAAILNMKDEQLSLLVEQVSLKNKTEDQSKVSKNLKAEDQKGNSNEIPLEIQRVEASIEEDDEDDDDDLDWQPLSDLAERMPWFCTNCTMPNSNFSELCDVCGEDQYFEIFPCGVLGLPLLPNQESSNCPRIMKEEERSLAPKKQTAIGFDERMLLHSENKPSPHPERPDRLRAIAASLKHAGLFPGKCSLIPAREVSIEELILIHSLEHVNAVELSGSKFSSYFTPDTYANEHSALAARLAAGLCADLATAIMKGEFRNGFALVRPPGHHAGVKDIMGFCLHNNAAVAVSACRSAGAKRVLIVDWDVHHGNGTQEIFNSDNSVLYISLHRHEGGKFYPGTGAATEVGTSEGEGFSVNIPWKHRGVGDNDYLFAFHHVVIPIAKEFQPDFTIVSAGFDAAKGDPLGHCEVTPNGFAHMADMLSNLLDGKMLVVLEGGYNLRSISASATSVVKVLLGERPQPSIADVYPSRSGFKTLLEVLQIQYKYWPSLKGHYLKLLSIWERLQSMDNRKSSKKRRCVGGPIWWKWGRKRVIYYNVFSKPLIKKFL